jgi:CheY-like chemotaxis protein
MLYELLYGFPPFHAPTPQEVFENILTRNINWHDDEVEISPECRDLMERLMCSSIEKRLGHRGADEVKKHPWFADVDWNALATVEASFVPKPANAEDTEYFDDRGAADQSLTDSELKSANTEAKGNGSPQAKTTTSPPDAKPAANTSPQDPALDEATADFGEFVYKNLTALEKANNDLVRKLRSDKAVTEASRSRSRTSSASSGSLALPGRPRIHSFNDAMPPNLATLDTASYVSRSSQGSPSQSVASTPITNLDPVVKAVASEVALKTKQRLLEQSKRRNSLPSRLHAAIPASLIDNASITSADTSSTSAHSASSEKTTPTTATDTSSYHAQYLQNAKQLLLQQQGRSLSTTSSRSMALSALPGPAVPLDNVVDHGTTFQAPPIPMNVLQEPRGMDVLIADDNPVARKILETMLTKLNCRCVSVQNGAEAIRCAMGDVKFDVIFMDIRMPISKLHIINFWPKFCPMLTLSVCPFVFSEFLPLVDGETAARMIRSTKNINQNTPVIAVTAYEQTFAQSQEFDDVMSKPVTRDIMAKVLDAVSNLRLHPSISVVD